DIDAMGIAAAAHSAGFVVRPGNNRSVIGRVIAPPADRGTGDTAFQRLHFRRIGALAILLVEGGADRAAEETAGDGPDRGAGKAISGAMAAEERAESAAGDRARDGSLILFRRIG